MEIQHMNQWHHFTLYESVTHFFLVASNVTGCHFRMVKISRTGPLSELSLFSDPHLYSRSEMVELLSRINLASAGGSQRSTSSNGGLIRGLVAQGVVGFVRFHLGYYLILVTKATAVAQLGQHIVYKVEDTTMLYLPSSTQQQQQIRRSILLEEERYLKYFQNFDLANDFYFCHTFDLTRSLQYNLHRVATPYSPHCMFHVRGRPDQHFAWNWHLVAPFADWSKCLPDDTNGRLMGVLPDRFQPGEEVELSQTCCTERLDPDWFVILIHGFVGYCQFPVRYQPLHFCLLARRSRHYAGARFYKRGANPLGYVANEVETEQMLWRADQSLLLQRCAVSSFVQHRGSIPLFWSQEMAKGTVTKPPINILSPDPFYQATGYHFGRLLSRYGAPLVVLNLVKQREKHPAESRLTQLYREAIAYLNQFLPRRYRIVYLGYDMARVQRSSQRSVFNTLAPLARTQIRRTGVFVQRPPLFVGDRNEENQQGMYQIQCGVIRTNCVDCLDRTNTAQFVIGKAAFAFQLQSIGIIRSTKVPSGWELDDMLEHLYDIHGDTLALQYGGSQLVHNVETYKKTAPFSSHARDIMKTLQRYYNNAFSDWDKQIVTNVFLGVYSSCSRDSNQTASSLPSSREFATQPYASGFATGVGGDVFMHWWHAWLHMPYLGFGTCHRPPYTDWLCAQETLHYLPCPRQLCVKISQVHITVKYKNRSPEDGMSLDEATLTEDKINRDDEDEENEAELEKSWYWQVLQPSRYTSFDDLPAVYPPGWSLPPHVLVNHEPSGGQVGATFMLTTNLEPSSAQLGSGPLTTATTGRFSPTLMRRPSHAEKINSVNNLGMLATVTGMLRGPSTVPPSGSGNQLPGDAVESGGVFSDDSASSGDTMMAGTETILDDDAGGVGTLSWHLSRGAEVFDQASSTYGRRRGKVPLTVHLRADVTKSEAKRARNRDNTTTYRNSRASFLTITGDYQSHDRDHLQDCGLGESPSDSEVQNDSVLVETHSVPPLLDAAALAGVHFRGGTSSLSAAASQTLPLVGHRISSPGSWLWAASSTEGITTTVAPSSADPSVIRRFIRPERDTYGSYMLAAPSDKDLVKFQGFSDFHSKASLLEECRNRRQEQLTCADVFGPLSPDPGREPMVTPLNTLPLAKSTSHNATLTKEEIIAPHLKHLIPNMVDMDAYVYVKPTSIAFYKTVADISALASPPTPTEGGSVYHSYVQMFNEATIM